MKTKTVFLFALLAAFPIITGAIFTDARDGYTDLAHSGTTAESVVSKSAASLAGCTTLPNAVTVMTLTAARRMATFTNLTDVDLIVTIGGVGAAYVQTGKNSRLDFGTNKLKIENGAVLKVYALNGVAPASGSLIVSDVY